VNIRIVATEPATSGNIPAGSARRRIARKRVWITDAYYLGAPTYVQTLVASARDGVDVRMLFTRAPIFRLLKVMSRTGYRTLLESGVRIFEWNGSLLHAKTAVIDGRWARVGSTNLNLASWIGNCELDAFVEDEGFAEKLETMYLEDLAHATEIVLERKRRLRPTAPRPTSSRRERKGSAGRAAVSAMRIGNVLGAALNQPSCHRTARDADSDLDRVHAARVRDAVRHLPPRLCLSRRVLLGWIAVTLILSRIPGAIAPPAGKTLARNPPVASLRPLAPERRWDLTNSFSF
jgi:hypothetical protein